MSYIYPDRVVSALTQTASAVSTNGNDFDTATGKGLIVTIDVTTLTAGTVTITVEGKDEVSGKYYTLLASTAIAATGTTVLRIYPGLTAAANAVANDITPSKCRVRSTIVTGPTTFTVGVNVVE